MSFERRSVATPERGGRRGSARAQGQVASRQAVRASSFFPTNTGSGRGFSLPCVKQHGTTGGSASLWIRQSPRVQSGSHLAVSQSTAPQLFTASRVAVGARGSLADFKAVVSIGHIVLAFCISFVSGVCFGFYRAPERANLNLLAACERHGEHASPLRCCLDADWHARSHSLAEAAFPFDFNHAFANTRTELRQRYTMQFALKVVARVGSCLSLLACVHMAPAQVPSSGREASVRGYWQEPSGGVIEVYPCEGGLCLRIAALSPGAHPRNDLHNPDPALRSRSLCGLRIGDDFTQIDLRHAEGGHLYDPRSGQTYSGSITAEGDTLRLRGYLGIKLLGRTETWRRVRYGHPTCTSG